MLYAPPLSPIRAKYPGPYYSSWFNHPNNIWWEVQLIKLLIMWSSLSPVISSHLPHITSSETYSQTPLAYIPPSMTEHNKNRKIKLNSLIVKFIFIWEILSAHSGTDRTLSLLEYAM
jgi:hypothetical protein